MNRALLKNTLLSISLCSIPARAAINLKNHLLPNNISHQAKKILTPKVIAAIKKRSPSVLKKAGFIVHPTIFGNIVAEHPKLPGWMIKGPRNNFCATMVPPNISRIAGAEKLRKAIAHNGLEKTFIVPQKYLFHYPNHSKDFSDQNYCVFAEKLALSDKHPKDFITKRSLTEHFTTIVKEAKFLDVHTTNIAVTRQGKIAFIDTEDFTFAASATLQHAMKLYQKYSLGKLSKKAITRSPLLTDIPNKVEKFFDALFFDMLPTQQLHHLMVERNIPLPNIITLARIALTPLIILAIFKKHWKLATALFAISAITDKFDGTLARKFDRISKFGATLDPLADKFLNLGTFFALAYSKAMPRPPKLLAYFELTRELLRTGLNVASKNIYGEAIPSAHIGKLSTVIKMSYLTWILLSNSLKINNGTINTTLLTSLVAIEIGSMAYYFKTFVDKAESTTEKLS